MTIYHAHAKLIEELGGPAKLASILFPDTKFGVQRVSNWMKRGIPAQIRLDRPDVFVPREAEIQKVA